MRPDFRIVQAETEEERSQVYRIRYEVFVRELGYNIPDATAEGGIVEQADEKSRLFLAYDGETPAGALALDLWQEMNLDASVVQHFHLQHFAQAFSQNAIAVVRKVLVLEPYRRTSLIMSLFRASLGFAASQHNIHFTFFDCSPYLVRHYERLGARRYAPHFYHDDTGILSVPMCFVLSDFEHFKRTRFRLLPVLKSHGRTDNPEVRTYFQEHWSTQETAPDKEDVLFSQFLVDEDEPLEVQSTPLFQGIDEAQVRYLASRCEAIPFKPGDLLMAAEAQDADLYILMQGYVEVTIEKDGRKIAIATRGPGDILGEMNLLLKIGRSATITAVTSGEAVRITEATFLSFLAEDASLAAQIYLNLARILAERVRGSSIWITQTPPL
jgi:hypothetical protein